MSAPPFERTTCACDDCIACCKRQPGPLAPGQLQEIAAHLHLSVEAASRFFCASPGALAMNTSTGELIRIRTITPKSTNSGRCIFLSEDDRCMIHGYAPVGCSHFDTHMSAEEGHRRGVWLYSAIRDDVEYQRLRSTLDAARSWNPVRI